MYARLIHPIGIPQQDKQGWSRWHIPWTVAIIVAFGLAPALISSVQAKKFQCPAGDVQCLIAAIAEAHASGKTKNQIDLEAGTYSGFHLC
jgi:hypothetical protein